MATYDNSPSLESTVFREQFCQILGAVCKIPPLTAASCFRINSKKSFDDVDDDDDETELAAVQLLKLALFLILVAKYILPILFSKSDDV